MDIGRIACETFWWTMGTGPEGQSPNAAWEWARSQGAQAAWEAAAEAVADHVKATLAREGCNDAAGSEMAQVRRPPEG